MAHGTDRRTRPAADAANYQLIVAWLHANGDLWAPSRHCADSAPKPNTPSQLCTRSQR
jgi:hypothetical protein